MQVFYTASVGFASRLFLYLICSEVPANYSTPPGLNADSNLPGVKIRAILLSPCGRADALKNFKPERLILL
jgi:hypothetical protein